MGTKGTVLCDWHSCGICNIVKSGFERVAFGALGHKGRSVQYVATHCHCKVLNLVPLPLDTEMACILPQILRWQTALLPHA